MGSYEDSLNELRAATGLPVSQPYTDSPTNSPAPNPASKNSLFQDFGNAVVSSTAGMGAMLPAAVGWTSDALGYQPGKDWSLQQLKNIGEFQKDFPTSVPSYTGVEDVGSAAHYAAGLAGNLLPSVLGGVGASYAGGAIGKHLGLQAAEGMLPAAAEEVLKKYVTRGALAGATTSSIGMEAGQIAQGQQEKNNDLSAAYGIPLSIISGLTEVVPFVDMFRRTGQWNKVLSKMFGVGEDVADGISRSPGFASLMGSIAKQGVRQMPEEMAQEGAQAFLERVGVPGETLWDAKAREDYINNILGGGMGGIMFGGAAGAGARVRQNAQPAGVRLSDIFQTNFGGPAATPVPGQSVRSTTDLPAIPSEQELTYLGRREHPPTVPPGLPAPTNMLPESVDSMGNPIATSLDYQGSVPAAPELAPGKHSWFGYNPESALQDESQAPGPKFPEVDPRVAQAGDPTSTSSSVVDLTNSPDTTVSVAPATPVDLTTGKVVLTPAISRAVEETNKLVEMLSGTTSLEDARANPTNGNLFVSDSSQAMKNIMQPLGILYNESERGWDIPRSKFIETIPAIQQAFPTENLHPAGADLVQSAQEGIQRPVFGEIPSPITKTRTGAAPSPTLTPLEQMINAAESAQPQPKGSQEAQGINTPSPGVNAGATTSAAPGSVPGLSTSPDTGAVTGPVEGTVGYVPPVASSATTPVTGTEQKITPDSPISNTEQSKSANTLRMNAMLKEAGLTGGMLAARPKQGAAEGLFQKGNKEPVGITFRMKQALKKLLGAGDKDTQGNIINQRMESNSDIGTRRRMGDVYGDTKVIPGYSVSSLEKHGTYRPELRGVAMPIKVRVSKGEAFWSDGRTAYKYSLANHYDANVDALQLWKVAQAMVSPNPHLHLGVVFSNLVYNSGYDGYVFNAGNTADERWAASFTPVKVMENLGQGYNPIGKFAANPQEQEAQHGTEEKVSKEPVSSMDTEITHEQLDQWITETINPQLPKNVMAKVVRSIQEMPDHARGELDRMQRKAGEVLLPFGYMHHETGTVYLFSPTVTTQRIAQEVLAHELFVHHSLYEMLGQEKFDKVMQQIHNSIRSDKNRFPDMFRLNRDIYKYDMRTPEGQRHIAEEQIAKTAETSENPSWFQEIVSSIREWLRSMGLTVSWSDADIRSLLRQSSDYLFNEAKLSAEIAHHQASGDLSIKVFHGSGSRFQKFDFDKIGSESGQMAYGWGAYVSDIQGVGEYYAEKAGKYSEKGTGWLGTFTIHKGQDPTSYHFLDWNTPVDQRLIAALRADLNPNQQARFDQTMSEYAKGVAGDRGAVVYSALRTALYDQNKEEAIAANNYQRAKEDSAKITSLYLVDHGISGMRYPAGKKRGGQHQGTTLGHDYVIYDERAIDVEKFQKTYQRKANMFMVSDTKRIENASTMVAEIHQDNLHPTAPPVEVNYLVNGKSVPQLKDLPNDPAVHRLWASINAVVKSAMNKDQSFVGFNRSIIEASLADKPRLTGSASAAWTDLQNFYASVLGTSAEPKRVKVTTETNDMPERMARFALKNAETDSAGNKNALQDNDFWKLQLEPYWKEAVRQVNWSGYGGELYYIRRNKPLIMKRSDDLRAAAQSIIDNKVKTMVPPSLETVGKGQTMALVRQSAVVFKEFKAAIDAWRTHMMDAIGQYARQGKPPETMNFLVNGKEIPDNKDIKNLEYRKAVDAINSLARVLHDPRSSREDRRVAYYRVDTAFNATRKGLGTFRPTFTDENLPKALSALREFFRSNFGGRQFPKKVQITPQVPPEVPSGHFAVRIKEMPFHATPQGTTEKSSPARVYDEAVQPKIQGHNSWIRQSDAVENTNRQLLIQFSTNLINKGAVADQATAYYDALYSGSRPGYTRLHDFWEIPQWMGFASHFLPNADVYVIQNMDEAKKFIAGAGYERVLSSAIDVNIPLLKDLASTLPNTTFDVGGYTENGTFSDIPNITWHESMKSFADSRGFPYVEGTDYRHFTGSAVVPRLTMSQGCLHKCAFCTVPKNLEMTSGQVIDQQTQSFGDLNSKLVYLNDKTFGQAKNYEHLVDVNRIMKDLNPDFEGFIVQTTASSLNKMSDQFLQDSGIKYVELGVESYNDLILKELHKPHTTSIIDKAVEKLRNNNIQLIPNIIIGLPAETAQTYAATQDFLNRNADVISHANIYNLALYKGSELASKITSDDANDIDENVMTKSFHVDKQIHADFSESVFSFGQKQLTGKGETVERSRSGNLTVRNDVNGTFTQPNDRWYAQPQTLSGRLQESLAKVKDWWHERVTPQLQHFKDLNYKDPSQLPIVEYLRQAEEIPRYARELVGRFNQRLLKILKNTQDRDTYEHISVLRDMLREATMGVVSQKGPQQVSDFLQAQGYSSVQQLETHIAHFESLINPAVQEALNLRKSFWDRWRNKAVAADILPDSVLGNDDYFHHQVKAWQELNDRFSGTAPGMHKTKKSFQKGRTGYAGEYNLNYFEGETGVLVDLITQVQTAKSLQEIRNNAKLNVLPLLVAEADRLNQAQSGTNQAKETWKTVLKRGNVLDSFGNPITEQTHEFYKPVRGNFFHKVLTLTERSIRKVMEELQNVVGPDPTLDELMDIARIHAGTAIAAGLRQPLIENYMVLNRQVIRAMEKFQEQNDPTFLGRLTGYLQTQWKRWILFNPFRVTRYLLNNTTGDADIAFAFRPAIFKHVGQAYKELYAWAYKDSSGLTNAQRNKLETLNRKGVLGSGITVQEIPELSDDTLTKLINDPKPLLIKRWFRGVHKFNNFRENIMRLAAWEYMNAEAAAGRFADLHYAASHKTEIDAIDSMDDKIVKMSRELIGDYGNLSYVGQKLRKYVIPFWSWTEINAPRYFKMMKNELRAGNTAGGLKIAGVMGAKAAVRAAAFAALVMAWNFAFFRDEEEEMRRLGRDQLHLILGRHSDGSVISLRIQGSFSDTMGWVGAENLLEELRSLKKGRVTPKEEAKSIAMAPVKRLIGGITPIYKTAAEAATGKSMFPEPFDTRPIRDKFQHIMKGVGLDWITDRYVSGKPAPPLFSLKTIATPFLYVTDTHEAAYFHAIKLANDWLKDQGMPRTSSEPTPRSNALYYWRQSTKLKDKEGEQYYKALYLELGGKQKNMVQSIKHTDPLVIIPLKLRSQFLNSMGEDNKKTWRMGVQWWKETFKGYPHAPGNTSEDEG